MQIAGEGQKAALWGLIPNDGVEFTDGQVVDRWVELRAYLLKIIDKALGGGDVLTPRPRAISNTVVTLSMRPLMRRFSVYPWGRFMSPKSTMCPERARSSRPGYHTRIRSAGIPSLWSRV